MLEELWQKLVCDDPVYEGPPIELLVDVRSHFEGRDTRGELLVELWTAYGRPKYGQVVLGMFATTFMMSDPCDYIPVYRIAGLDPVTAAPKLCDTPLYRYEHPQRYARIANLWEHHAELKGMESIAELAARHGFIAGSAAGYTQPDLWVKDSEGGGHKSVYRHGRRWVVAFFGPGANIPFASKSFPGVRSAFKYATG